MGIPYVRRVAVDMNQLRRFGPRPKSEDHFSHDKPCPACHQPFKAGDYTTLIALGPGSDEESQERAREGRAYNAVALEVHWTCATGLVEED